MPPELYDRIALGRAIRAEAHRLVAVRGRQAEAAALAAARDPRLDEAGRCFAEAVAGRVSRMFALVGRDILH